MEPIIFLDVEDVLLLHADTIDTDGGSHGLRDHGLLDAAVAMPRQQFGGQFLHEDLAAMAAAYLFHIAQNHPFVDGNKRTAFVVCRTFLLLNGHDLKASRAEKYFTIIKLAEGTLTEEEMAAWIRERLEATSP